VAVKLGPKEYGRIVLAKRGRKSTFNGDRDLARKRSRRRPV
jgi:hypothetical protein